MKRKLIIFFSCVLIFINLMPSFILTASAVPFDLDNPGSYHSWDNSGIKGRDVRKILYTSLFFAAPQDDFSGFLPKDYLSYFPGLSYDGSIIICCHNMLYIIHFLDDTSYISIDTSSSVPTFHTDGSYMYRSIGLNDYIFTADSYTGGYDISFYKSFSFFYSFDEYYILYSDYDIVVDDEPFYSADRVLNTNLDWFDVSCNPELKEGMSFSTKYTSAQGKEEIAADYTLSVSVSKSGKLFKDDLTERLLNNYSQCFTFISTEPVSEDGDYSAALNSCIYLHYEQRQYYADYVFDPDYDINDAINRSHDIFTGRELEMAKSYSLLFGYVPYDTFYSSKKAKFSIDLNGVPLEVDKTYYLNVIAMPISQYTVGHSSGISKDNPLTSIMIEFADGSKREVIHLPMKYITEFEDLSQLQLICKSAAFSLSDLDGYEFVDKSEEFGIDPYVYSDEKLQSDKYPDTVKDRSDYERSGNSYKPSSSVNSDVLSNTTASSLFLQVKNVIPFVKLSFQIFPDPVYNYLILIMVLPLVFVLSYIILSGIKFLISLFGG